MILMHFKAMPHFGVTRIAFFQKHVCDGPNKPQLRAVAQIWRGDLTWTLIFIWFPKYWASEPVNVLVLHFTYFVFYFLFHSGLSPFILFWKLIVLSNCIQLNLSDAKFRIKIAKLPGGSVSQKHCFQLTPLRRLIDCHLKYYYLKLLINLVIMNFCYQ